MSDLPEELVALRQAIDETDADIVALLIRRFDLTWQVGQLKARQSLDSFDPKREASKLERLQALCAQSKLEPQLVEELFTRIMQEVVKNHRRLKQESEL